MSKSFIKVAIFCTVVIFLFVYIGEVITSISGTGKGPLIIAEGTTPT
jgi:hypothetical protein